MKDQASLNLLIVDSPIDNKALEGHLMLRATSSGLKIYDNSGSESQLGGGASSWNDLADRPTYLTTPVNTPNGIPVLDGTGKLPTHIIPASTVDLSSYEGAVSITASESEQIVLKGLGSPESYNSTVTIEGGIIDIDAGVGTVYFTAHTVMLGKMGGGSLQMAMINAADLMLNGASLNNANGLVKLGSDGKIPSNLYSATVDLTNYNGNVAITSESTKFSLNSSGSTFVGSALFTSGQNFEIGSGGGMYNNVSTNAVTVNIRAQTLLYNNNPVNSANGLVVLNGEGKLPSSIIPSSNSMSYTPITISGNDLDSNGIAVIQHNLGTQYLLCLDYTVTPKEIHFYDSNTLKLDFSNQERESFSAVVWFLGSNQDMLAAPQATP